MRNRFENTIYRDDYTWIIVQGIPLMEMIEEHGLNKIDLLQIDTEGYNAKVISMFNFRKFNPKIIQYEHVHLSSRQKIDILRLLNSEGYYTIEKMNDVIAIKKPFARPEYLLAYYLMRLIESSRSRLINFCK